jgi:hypothetical protein
VCSPKMSSHPYDKWGKLHSCSAISKLYTKVCLIFLFHLYIFLNLYV